VRADINIKRGHSRVTKWKEVDFKTGVTNGSHHSDTSYTEREELTTKTLQSINNITYQFRN